MIFGQKIYFENKKCQGFDMFASNCLTRYQKILWGGSLWCKKLLEFSCLTMKFHNRHHTTHHALYSWTELSKKSLCFLCMDQRLLETLKCNAYQTEYKSQLFVYYFKPVCWAFLYENCANILSVQKCNQIHTYKPAYELLKIFTIYFNEI